MSWTSSTWHLTTTRVGCSKWLPISRQCGLDEHVALCREAISSNTSSVQVTYDELTILDRQDAEWYMALKDSKLCDMVSLEAKAGIVGKIREQAGMPNVQTFLVCCKQPQLLTQL